MNISELLRNLADKLDQVSHSEEPTADTDIMSQNLKAARAPETQELDGEEMPLPTMVPPLQQKIELLKRSVGIDNVFDGSPVDKTDDDENELEIIKKNAGISPNTAAIMSLSDDEPLD